MKIPAYDLVNGILCDMFDVGFKHFFIRGDVGFVIKDIFDAIIGAFGLALFHTEGHLALEIPLCGGQLFLCDAVFNEVIEELEEEGENTGFGFVSQGLGGVTKGIYFEMSGGRVMDGSCGRRIGEAVFFAQEHEEPARHISADDVFE